MNLPINYSRLVPAVVLSILLIAVALLSIPRGLASFMYYPVNRSLEHWLQYDGRTVNDEHNQFMKARLEKALQWDPANPDIQVSYSVLLDRGMLDQYFWEQSADSTYRESLQILKTVARTRPVSPWIWINIALTKAKLRQYDTELEHSLINATRLGPWEPLVNIRVADIGLAKWGYFSEPVKVAVIESIRRGLEQSSKEIYQIAKNHHRFPLLCEQLAAEMGSHDECRPDNR